MAGLPKISCFCSTYGRVRCLEEAIHSFLQQDYCGEKELVILNDREDQVLAFEHPEVTIINSPERIEPLGKKFNRNIDFCDGDVLAAWENEGATLGQTKVQLDTKSIRLNKLTILDTGSDNFNAGSVNVRWYGF